MNEEFWQVADPSIDLFFYIWEQAIIEDTIQDNYPYANIPRLIELHAAFDERFDQLVSAPEVDFDLAYDSEHNQAILQEVRELMDEHIRFYNDFRAALEGREN